MPPLQESAPFRRYVPILRGKANVLLGLGDVADAIQAAMLPLIEVQPPDLEPLSQQPRRTLHAELDAKWLQIRKAWRDSSPLRLDLGFIDSAPGVPNAGGALTHLLRLARTDGRPCIPVVSPMSSAGYRQAALRAHAQDGLGICLRVPVAPFRKVGGLGAAITAELQSFSVPATEIDLVLDEAAISRRLLSATQAARGDRQLVQVPITRDWRTLVWAGTAKPRAPGSVRELQLHGNQTIISARLQRTEWTSWWALRSMYAARQPVPRIPTFGDYVLEIPGYRPIDPRVMKVVAQIWYSTDGAWLAYRGRQVNTFGRGQYSRMARDLVTQPEFATPVFSSGDLFLSQIAARTPGTSATGSAASVLRAATSHHLTWIVTQLAKLPPGP